MSATATPDLLATIVAATRRIVSVRQAAVPIASLERQIARGTQAAKRPGRPAFAAAVRDSAPPRIIAECKRRSPSRGVLRRDYDPAGHAAAYQAAGAAAISVLTEPTFFDGSPDHLRQARAAVTLPLLRKDFIVSDYQLVEAAALGADAVLLIAAALSDGDLRTLLGRAGELDLAALVEVHDLTELRRAADAGAAIIGVNSRNLRTLAVDARVFDALAAALPPGVTAVAESGLRTAGDLQRLSAAGYHAFLVGERLMTEPDPGAALRALREPQPGVALPPSGGGSRGASFPWLPPSGGGSRFGRQP